MEIGQSRIGNYLVLRPVGRLDNFSSLEFQPVLLHAVSSEPGVICDLAAVDYISSAGLRTLTAATKALGEQGRLAVANLQPAVKEVFAIARLQHVVSIFGTPEEAAVDWRRSADAAGRA